MNDLTPPLFAWTVTYVDDVDASLDFYTRAFALDIAFRGPEGDYAEFATGSTALALCQRSLAADSTGLALGRSGSPRGNITLVVADVAAAFERAVAAGARPVRPPVTKPWGQICSYVADLDDNLIELATRVADA